MIVPFNYKSLDDVRREADAVGAYIPLSENIGILNEPVNAGGINLKNRLIIHPMEGCDGYEDGGAPAELTWRRYRRFAAGGAGLIWFEAVAILHEGRANPRQLMITDANLDDYKRLVDEMREISVKTHGFSPVIIMQATHSGRYSKPDDDKVPAPLIARNNPVYEKDKPISQDRIVSDEYLKNLSEYYFKAAKLAEAAGFDGVDIKACHGYLQNELFASRTREGSLYGGMPLANRTRLFSEAFSAAKSATPAGFIVTARMNVHDGIPCPYGFGAAENSPEPDLTEPIELIQSIRDECGLKLLNVTIGNPYFNPHVNRPYDRGGYEPPEHPLTGVSRMFECTRKIKKTFPDIMIVASALSYLRQFAPNAAAGLVNDGAADLVGFGRNAFAYPEFAGDILNKSGLDPKKCCLTCGKCTELMRAGTKAGCVLRDEVYQGIYKAAVK